MAVGVVKPGGNVLSAVATASSALGVIARAAASQWVTVRTLSGSTLIVMGNFVERDDRMDEVSEELESMDVPSGAPAGDFHLAKATARDVMERLRESDLAPERLVSNSDGDIGFYFFGTETLPGGSHRRYARIGCSVEGLTLTLEDRVERKLEVTDIETDDASIDQAVATIQAHLQQ
jgi:hypothetical protein